MVGVARRSVVIACWGEGDGAISIERDVSVGGSSDGSHRERVAVSLVRIGVVADQLGSSEGVRTILADGEAVADRRRCVVDRGDGEADGGSVRDRKSVG